ncbi:MAG: DUF2231 domain-containing protein [Deltaproteobacteria bacterium]|nr:DUF2231 domain-containing protein [Deltaproteobacteria bacterium]
MLGLVSTLITVFTGYWAETSFPHGETVHRMMKTHQTIGFTILGLGGLLTIWSFLKREGIPKASKLFLFLLGFVVLLILQNADLGMRMVFIEGAAVKAVSNNGEAEGENSGHHHGDENPNSHNHKEN